MAKLTYFLDTRGKVPSLRLALQLGQKRTTISLDTFLNPEQWDGEKVINHPNAKAINSFISMRMSSAQSVLYDLQNQGKLNSMSIAEVRNEIMAKVDPNYISREGKGLLSYQFKKYIERITTNTARIYENAYKNICYYCASKKIDVERLRIDDISFEFLSDLQFWMKEKRHLKQNTVAIDLSCMRAVCNYACKSEAATKNPFRNFSIKIEETRHRVVPIDILREFFSFQCTRERQEEYQSIAKLIFLLIGINLADLYDLTYDNLTADGCIEYRRRKTGRMYKIKIEPEAKEIIAKYRGETKLLRICESLPEQSFKTNFSKYLRKIGEKGKSIFSKMSSYWLRHTWATVASDIDIPFDVIARGLGHAWAKETDTYVRFDQRKIDEANRKVIDYVFYNKV